ncbi:MAG TPA: flavin-dependent oxidoreductase [Steroidobacteraceae bacterium]|nr:flavin-dependent oxidoreductase [Steroidobacteraceae bacterium]
MPLPVDKAGPVIVAGGGIGGLALGLCLHRHGIPVRVFERVPELKPLGVGINLLPHAARVLHELGLADELQASAIQTSSLSYFNKFGQKIWSEPRGVAAGYPVPQYSIHRGELHLLLFRAALERLGPACVVTGAGYEAVRQEGDEVIADFLRTDGTGEFEVRGRALIGADGIHSLVRRAMYPNEGLPRFAKRILWRGTTMSEPFLDGRSMIMAGHPDQKFVCYPISRQSAEKGRSMINWIAELSVPQDAPPPQDWNAEVPKSRFAPRFEGWDFGWLNAAKLIDEAKLVYEFPLVDRDPLPSWTRGRVTLLGDAAHPMYPIGSNGASQAILDAEVLAAALRNDDVDAALAEYESARRPATSKIVLSNRQNGPEQVMQIAEERAPRGFNHVNDVIPQAELAEIAARYKQTAGFTVDDVKKNAR